MLDANANRAREALRVMEDVARFALNDERLSRELKALRHALRDALASLPAGWIEAGRNVRDDVGTAISTANERSRRNLAEVATAAGKRLSESLRSIEECLKIVDERAAGDVEQLRYRAYELEARLALRTAPLRAKQWGVCVLLSERACKRPWRDVAQAVIAGGADAIQVREKEMDAPSLCQRVREVIELARPAGVSVIVNDRVDVALACGADGVHLGANDMAIADARRVAGRSLIIGASTHSSAEAERAVAEGADYCGVGMMYPSTTKRDRTPEGPDVLRRFVERFPAMPHLAIGGITPQRAGELASAGARGVAVAAAVCGAAEPDQAVRALRHALEHAEKPAAVT
jgi:thiamine-phosphate pyrophosphorylase